ncbi:EC1118_1L7_1002p [Saccharomyces cerevisiae EC1118]|uniref:EC1118_1L7_1002p n=1 Tax=Saccharomyces cerevisiae (strain Lalvin EC1118 / Prise de mousse) TaxID=643680 RepID=C8ZDL5_YEAS8|nr:EC1118_1L7_1002p [Saccharomyces cerevisiae EC1118]
MSLQYFGTLTYLIKTQRLWRKTRYLFIIHPWSNNWIRNPDFENIWNSTSIFIRACSLGCWNSIYLIDFRQRADQLHKNLSHQSWLAICFSFTDVLGQEQFI